MPAGISRHINGTINASWSGIFLPVPAFRQVSWLTDHHTKPPSQIFQNSPVRLLRFFSDRAFAHGFVFPVHSDEIVQVFHLFPFYLLSALFRAAAAPDASSIVMGDILASSALLCKNHCDISVRAKFFKQIPRTPFLYLSCIVICCDSCLHADSSLLVFISCTWNPEPYPRSVKTFFIRVLHDKLFLPAFSR